MPQQRSMEIGVEPHEVVFGEPQLTVRAPSALDPETARGALSLSVVRGSVELSRDGRTATFVPEKKLAPGAYTLTVQELVTKTGKRVGERTEIPFFVVDSKAKVGDRLRVESFVRLRVERLGTQRLPLDNGARG